MSTRQVTPKSKKNYRAAKAGFRKLHIELPEELAVWVEAQRTWRLQPGSRVLWAIREHTLPLGETVAELLGFARVELARLDDENAAAREQDTPPCAGHCHERTNPAED